MNRFKLSIRPLVTAVHRILTHRHSTHTHQRLTLAVVVVVVAVVAVGKYSNIGLPVVWGGPVASRPTVGVSNVVRLREHIIYDVLGAEAYRRNRYICDVAAIVDDVRVRLYIEC